MLDVFLHGPTASKIRASVEARHRRAPSGTSDVARVLILAGWCLCVCVCVCCHAQEGVAPFLPGLPVEPVWPHWRPRV